MTATHGYPILRRWLKEALQDRTPVTPTLQVIHSTANTSPGAGDEMHFRWLDGARRHGWATWYLDHDSISEVVPEGLKAPAQGPTMNMQALSMELCEPDASLPWSVQVERFRSTWDRAVWLAAYNCLRYGWTVEESTLSHAQVSQMYPGETDHTDPIGFFERYGRNWQGFIAAVNVELARQQGALPPAAEWQQTIMDQLMKTGLLSERRHPRQSLEWWEAAALITRVDARRAELEERVKKLEERAPS